MAVRNVPVAEVGSYARDVMLAAPETVPAALTVAEARSLLESPRMRMLLVCDEQRLIGTISRERLESETDDDLPLGSIADVAMVRVRSGETVERILQLLESNAIERLPVVDEDERLLGLICFNRRKRHFCIDEAPA